MSFNPDPSKQAQEVIFSRKYHPPIYFNDIPVTQTIQFKNILGCILMKNSITIVWIHSDSITILISLEQGL